MTAADMGMKFLHDMQRAAGEIPVQQKISKVFRHPARARSVIESDSIRNKKAYSIIEFVKDTER